MKQVKNNKGLIAIVQFLLLIFVAFYSNISLFQHCHIINGVTIVHSHFHNDGHGGSTGTSHSTVELTLIAHVSQLEALVETGTLLPDCFDVLLEEVNLVPFVDVALGSHSFFSLRAPPIV